MGRLKLKSEIRKKKAKARSIAPPLSQFIPFGSVLSELDRQNKVVLAGLKSGRLVRYPDEKTGPYIITQEKFEEIKAKKAVLKAIAESEVLEENKELLQTLEDK